MSDAVGGWRQTYWPTGPGGARNRLVATWLLVLLITSQPLAAQEAPEYVWLRNHADATLWSWPGAEAEAFRVIPQFLGLFRATAPLHAENGRIYVHYPGDSAGGVPGDAWVDLELLGPSEPPEHNGPIEWPQPAPPPLVSEWPREMPPGVGRVVRRIETTAPLVALTLDDAIDHDALDVLAERQVKATLFLSGAWAQSRPDTIARAVADGHELGNHTWGHPNLVYAHGAVGTQNEIRRANSVLAGITGAPSIPAFRPPYGAWNLAVLQGIAAEGYDLYLWEIDSNGYRYGADPASVAAGVITRARPGSIILMHPLAHGDRYALAAVVDGLRSVGLEPARLSDLLHAAGE